MCYNCVVQIKRGVKIMKYKILEREDYAEELDFHFYIEKNTK